MYFVDRKKIEHILTYIEELASVFPEVTEAKTKKEQLALERITQGWIEAITDTGNQVIDGFIMRDPGGYEDIIDILHDEKVVPEQDVEGLKQVIRLRKKLVQEYYNIDYGVLQDVLTTHSKSVEQFPAHVRYYLENELGPVSAFLPNDNKTSEED
ncbi:uncharacterized protein YutE (UPF0331/DUF86 family) [Salibacterium salarium]|uniref:DUF86 domain-containing protein n=1 Tax=Salibacterium salarium TaxID=284579 RepID=UPI0027898279|nr:DUF86 domain-containing protein [Salibacterium salarium]MDQ0298401.1 uncharacterized protein YutE (UPF0331/DUF86 family) [Salibacterium salarium]